MKTLSRPKKNQNAKQIRNITWHDSMISKSDSEKRNGHKGVCIWLTGLPCSGKSTIAVGLQRALFYMGCQTYILDGDNIRHGLNKDLGFSPKERTENIRRIGEVARLFTEAGLITIVAFISPYRKDRQDVRAIFGNKDFIEIYIKASLRDCQKRDTKGLYKRARSGEIKEFTGISAPYEEPARPEILIDTEIQNKEEGVRKALDYLIKNKYIPENRSLKR